MVTFSLSSIRSISTGINRDVLELNFLQFKIIRNYLNCRLLATAILQPLFRLLDPKPWVILGRRKSLISAPCSTNLHCQFRNIWCFCRWTVVNRILVPTSVRPLTFNKQHHLRLVTTLVLKIPAQTCPQSLPVSTMNNMTTTTFQLCQTFW